MPPAVPLTSPVAAWTDHAYGNDVLAALTIGFVNATASGNTQVVAASAGKKIRVVACMMINNGSVVRKAKLQSATTDITATKGLAVNGGFETNRLPGFYCETNAGEALNVNLDSTGDVAVTLEYILI